MTDLRIGSRRLVNCFDGNGGDDWIPATLEAFSIGDEPYYAVFALDRPTHQGVPQCCIPLPGGAHRMREEPTP